MPYNKNKQQAFQAAQQAFVQAQQAFKDLEPADGDSGHHFKKAHQEIIEAEQVIYKAHINASEHQRHELRGFEEQLAEIKENLNQY